MQLNRVMREVRKARGLSLKEFAPQIGCSTATLSRFENGKSLDGDTLAKIIRWLLGGTEEA